MIQGGPAVDVVIVNLDGGELTLAAVASVAADAAVVAETIVIDNGSRRDDLGVIRHHEPAVRLIANRSNLGFAEACNQGIAASRARYVCLLNNDAWVIPGTLTFLVDALDGDPSLAAIQALVLRADGRGIDTAGIAWNGRGEALPIAAGAPVGTGSAPVSVPGVSATVAVYRRSALGQVAGGGAPFPRHFFAYYEDVDLSLRFLRTGWTLACHHGAKAYHHGSMTGSRTPWQRALLTGTNRWRTLGRNFAPAFLAARLPRLLRADLAHARHLGFRGGALLLRIAPLVLAAITPKSPGTPARLHGFPEPSSVRETAL